KKVKGKSERRKSLILFLSLLPFTFLLLPFFTGAAPEETSVELVAVGDVLLDRGIARQIESKGTRVVFARVKDVLSNSDLAFANLECPLTKSCERSPQRISFRAEPRYVDALTSAGFDIVSLANNHSMDCGSMGLLETMRNLSSGGVRFCGAGLTPAEASAPVILNARGIRIAFLAFTNIAPAAASVSQKDDAPTVALTTGAAVERAVSAARLEADVVVVSLHWGLEYASRPTAEQVRLAHSIVEAGADLILGHHTHTLEGVELVERRESRGIRQALIIYSLGNFAFDSPRAIGRRVRESVILRCRLGRTGLISAQLLPVVLENHLPRPASIDEARNIFTRLGVLSGELKTRIKDGHVILK
ncbi:MAG: CapA family protein, partial [Acidobacteria bacterium]|nr:CapA family protein [Acidobacteriota bacterium]